LIAAIVRVKRSTLIRSAATGMWKRREEIAFYASSLMLPAETFACAIRGHWAVESAPQAHTRRRFAYELTDCVEAA
jgi:predicted transposase YbfD/YdcC